MTFASPRDLGATWFIGLDYANAIKLVKDYRPGDICITNDPYSGYVCTHTPDLHMWKPIFWEGELVAFAVSHIHNTDVGGAVPASLSRTLTEVHQEGIRIPPSKIYNQGKLNQELLDVMLLNVRMPEQNWGDLQAQIAGMNTGERKVHDMIRKFGVETFPAGREGPPRSRREAGAQPDPPDPRRRVRVQRLPGRGRARRRAGAPGAHAHDP